MGHRVHRVHTIVHRVCTHNIISNMLQEDLDTTDKHV